MLIRVNGKEENVQEGISLIEFLTFKQVDQLSIVIEYNFNIIKNVQWSSIILKENDTLEILRFVGGG